MSLASSLLAAHADDDTPAPWHILGAGDIGPDHAAILRTAHALKAQASRGPLPPLLAGKAVALIFEKNSTRTRVSFEIGIQRLGGIVTTLDGQNSQLGRGESLEDTAGVLSRYAQAIVYRAKDHASATELARHATVPVVNALTDMEHPCQILADLQTLDETWGGTDGSALAGRTVAWIGDGNNVCHSWLLAAPLVGLNVHVATPPQYAPEPAIMAQAQTLAKRMGTRMEIGTDPRAAASEADAIATDTWISMGDETDREARLQAFRDFVVDDDLMSLAAPGAVFLHCLPGHWGEEATHDVAHGPASLIFDQAENRMWSQMALLVHLLDGAAMQDG